MNRPSSSPRNLPMRRRLRFALAVLLAGSSGLAGLAGLAGCSDDGGDDGSDSQAPAPDAAAGSLPEVCRFDPYYNEDCASEPGRNRAAICQGAPVEMSTVHDCAYQGARVGIGNFYCCP